MTTAAARTAALPPARHRLPKAAPRKAAPLKLVPQRAVHGGHDAVRRRRGHAARRRAARAAAAEHGGGAGQLPAARTRQAGQGARPARAGAGRPGAGTAGAGRPGAARDRSSAWCPADRPRSWSCRAARSSVSRRPASRPAPVRAASPRRPATAKPARQADHQADHQADDQAARADARTTRREPPPRRAPPQPCDPRLAPARDLPARPRRASAARPAARPARRPAHATGPSCAPPDLSAVPAGLVVPVCGCAAGLVVLAAIVLLLAGRLVQLQGLQPVALADRSGVERVRADHRAGRCAGRCSTATATRWPCRCWPRTSTPSRGPIAKAQLPGGLDDPVRPAQPSRPRWRRCSGCRWRARGKAQAGQALRLPEPRASTRRWPPG